MMTFLIVVATIALLPAAATALMGAFMVACLLWDEFAPQFRRTRARVKL